MLTRTGYIVTDGPIQEIKKELTVRPRSTETMDFLHHLSKFSDQLRMESAFQDSTELLKLENPKRIRDQNPPGSIPNLSDNLGILHTKMMPSEQQLKQGMVCFLYHAGMAKRRYPWP